MKYPWIESYLLSKPGVTKNIQKDWNWHRYYVGDKMFASVCMDWENQPYYVTLKLEPLEGELLRQEYEDIIPGYYMNKLHWNSIRVQGSVPDETVRQLLDHAYSVVFASLTKKRQREIRG